ncbi:hypothetical protein GUITHDRAFT_146817 [Guillardia theta CCMP2712]|uniref:Uncharacterized protein n=1 Tax=Guillardia theta (strain CCMP2712) TaxID=905079 RepID=L1IFE8_GUITC|nr:hypothetical protein GUITHDRAFT_146817 [Guillardia theta CCMP2712]EKX34986.1 hypothetical protein GUITHDRAFT_146817 [Guillardia theta CCMP2712]|eukprot:XP_005821966.1 hypothetical protein GUITHDRAFT_146817 [Guillardia theta CCMP2712]
MKSPRNTGAAGAAAGAAGAAGATGSKKELPEVKHKAMQEVYRSKMKESRCMSCGMDMDKLFLHETGVLDCTDGSWLCGPCSLKRTNEDTGQWKLYAHLVGAVMPKCSASHAVPPQSFPIHAACAAGNLNAVTELWEGVKGSHFLFEVRKFARDINLPAKLEEVEDGWPPLAFAVMSPEHVWPPPYIMSDIKRDGAGGEEEEDLSIRRNKTANIHLVRFLLEKGADPVWSDKYGRSLSEYCENAEIWELTRLARKGELSLRDAKRRFAERDFVAARKLLDEVKPDWKAAGLLERLATIQPIERQVDEELIQCIYLLSGRDAKMQCTTRDESYGEALAGTLEVDGILKAIQLLVDERDQGEGMVEGCYKKETVIEMQTVKMEMEIGIGMKIETEFARTRGMEVENKKKGIRMEDSQLFAELQAMIENVWFVAAQSASSLECLVRFFLQVIQFEQVCMTRFKATGEVEGRHEQHFEETELLLSYYHDCVAKIFSEREFLSEITPKARFQQREQAFAYSIQIARTAEKKRQSQLAFEHAGILLNKEFFEEARDSASRAAAIMHDIGEVAQERIMREFIDDINNNEDVLKQRKVMIKVQTACGGQEAVGICNQLLATMFDDARAWTSKRVVLKLPFHDVHVR